VIRHLLLFAAMALSLIPLPRLIAQQPTAGRWTSTFEVPADEWTSTGRNPYFVLEAGYTLVLASGAEQLAITVLNDTRLVDGVETRVVEERETDGGRPVEVSRNFYAMSRRTNSVFYFGEEVDEYRNGTIAGHPGAWMSGTHGAHFGLMMPGQPLLGARYQQEIAPRVAMDRAEVVSLTDVVRTPAGEFKNVLRTNETTPLEPLVHESKCYAPGVGLIQDGSLKLVRYGR
jgi:hypothetical protein